MINGLRNGLVYRASPVHVIMSEGLSLLDQIQRCRDGCLILEYIDVISVCAYDRRL